MAWKPSEDTRITVKFWLDCLQVLTVTIAVVTAFVTVERYRKEYASQVDAIKRDLQRPYREKKLSLYLEASKVLAHLAATPDIEPEKYQARFWELYWGELAFVESTTSGEANGGPAPSVERLMVEFCHQAFPGQCSKGSSTEGSAKLPNNKVAAAIELARQASKEVRADWEDLNK